MNKDEDLKVRKKPIQKRSRETVEAIFDAAAQILSEKGYAQTTTDRIAEKAGISIGSLYQYFPNKDSIMLGIIERHIQEMNAFVEEMISAIQSSGIITRQMINNFAKLMIEHHDKEPELHRVLFEESPQPQSIKAAINKAEKRAANGLTEVFKKSSEGNKKNPELSIRIAVRTIEALTHWYVLEANDDIPEDDFIDELAEMINGYLRIME